MDGEPIFSPEPPPFPPPVERRGRRSLGIAALAAGSLASGALGGLIGVLASHATSSPSSATAGGRYTQSPPGLGGTSTASGAAGVAATVSQSVVDITGTVNGGEVAGTGMVISSDGEVLTNNHVVAGTTSLHVQLDGTGPEYTATVLGVDPGADVALIKVQNVSGWKTVSFASAASVSTGEQVSAIGNAGNRPGTPSVTTGQIVAIGRTITASDDNGSQETLTGLYQINAVLEPGDSGGPLIDATGKVVGMDTAAQSGPGLSAASDVGFAIPAGTALAIVHQVQAGDFNGAVQTGSGAILGVQVAAQQGRGTAGAAVAGVQSDSPAQRAGITAGSVITALGGAPIDSEATLHDTIRTYRPGMTAAVTWIDARGATHTASVTFASGPPA